MHLELLETEMLLRHLFRGDAGVTQPSRRLSLLLAPRRPLPPPRPVAVSASGGAQRLQAAASPLPELPPLPFSFKASKLFPMSMARISTDRSGLLRSRSGVPPPSRPLSWLVLARSIALLCIVCWHDGCGGGRGSFPSRVGMKEIGRYCSN